MKLKANQSTTNLSSSDKRTTKSSRVGVQRSKRSRLLRPAHSTGARATKLLSRTIAAQTRPMHRALQTAQSLDELCSRLMELEVGGLRSPRPGQCPGAPRRRRAPAGLTPEERRAFILGEPAPPPVAPAAIPAAAKRLFA